MPSFSYDDGEDDYPEPYGGGYRRWDREVGVVRAEDVTISDDEVGAALNFHPSTYASVESFQTTLDHYRRRRYDCDQRLKEMVKEACRAHRKDDLDTLQQLLEETRDQERFPPEYREGHGKSIEMLRIFLEEMLEESDEATGVSVYNLIGEIL